MEVSMIILDRYLSSNGLQLKICGTVTRGVAHFHGVPHGAVNIAIVVLKKADSKLTPHILLFWRDKWKKTCPETWDICGGHLEGNKKIMNDKTSWDNQKYIEELFDKTALREANEEFCIINQPEFEFDEERIKCFGGTGAFEYGFDNPTRTNKEYSTFYIAFIPKDILVVEEQDEPEKIFRVEDTIGVGGKIRESEATKLRLLTLDELALDFTKNPSNYADGIERILKRAVNEPYTMSELNRFLNSYYDLS